MCYVSCMEMDPRQFTCDLWQRNFNLNEVSKNIVQCVNVLHYMVFLTLDSIPYV